MILWFDRRETKSWIIQRNTPKLIAQALDNVAIEKGPGWAVGSPFQTELAFYHLGLGGVGIMAWWRRDHLWTALVLAKAIFLYGAAYVHIRDIILFDNWAPSNAGFEILYLSDLILPTVILGLWIAYSRVGTRHTQMVALVPRVL